MVATLLQTPPCLTQELEYDGGGSSKFYYYCLHGGYKLEIRKGMNPSKGPMERYGSELVEVEKSNIRDLD
jgi:hypothetical protein